MILKISVSDIGYLMKLCKERSMILVDNKDSAGFNEVIELEHKLALIFGKLSVDREVTLVRI